MTKMDPSPFPHLISDEGWEALPTFDPTPFTDIFTEYVDGVPLSAFPNGVHVMKGKTWAAAPVVRVYPCGVEEGKEEVKPNRFRAVLAIRYAAYKENGDHVGTKCFAVFQRYFVGGTVAIGDRMREDLPALYNPMSFGENLSTGVFLKTLLKAGVVKGHCLQNGLTLTFPKPEHEGGSQEGEEDEGKVDA